MKKQLMTALTALTILAPAVSAAPLAVTNNPQGFISNPQTRARLIKLIGNNSYNTMKRNFQVTSVLQRDSSIVAYSGCQRNNCADTQSLVVYDRENDTLKAFYWFSGKTLEAQENGDLSEVLFNDNLSNAIEEFYNHGN